MVIDDYTFMDYKNTYIEFLKKWIKVGRSLTVVFDASNGPAGMIIRDLFTGTNINAIVINDEIDPDFKAHGPNPLMDGAMEECKKVVIENQADMGILFDADADRAFFLNDKGEVIHACFIIGFLKNEFKPPFVMDELVYQSVRLLNVVPDEHIIPSKIGTANIKENILKHKACFGVELSGHYFFSDFFNTDSAIFASIKVLNSLSKIDMKLSDWRKNFGEFETITKEIKIQDDKEMSLLYDDLERIYGTQADRVEKRDGITFVFPLYWINVRSSNTEPIMRIIAGGKGEIRDKVREIEELIG